MSDEATFVAMGMVFFQGPRAWAQGMAVHHADQTYATAAQAAVVNHGKAAQRNSYFGAFEVMPDGQLVPVEVGGVQKVWHLNDQGQPTVGWPGHAGGPLPDPQESPSDPQESPGESPGGGPGGPRAWEPWVWFDQGEECLYDGKLWVCLQGHTTQPGWEPGGPGSAALWTLKA